MVRIGIGDKLFPELYKVVNAIFQKDEYNQYLLENVKTKSRIAYDNWNRNSNTTWLWRMEHDNHGLRKAIRRLNEK